MSAPTENMSFQVKLDFPDAKARGDFETAFQNPSGTLTLSFSDRPSLMITSAPGTSTRLR